MPLTKFVDLNQKSAIPQFFATGPYIPTFLFMMLLLAAFLMKRVVDETEKTLIRAGKMEDPEKRLEGLLNISGDSLKCLAVILLALFGLELAWVISCIH